MGEPDLLALLLSQERDHSLILMDVEGRIVGWHAAAPLQFGYDADEIRGKSVDRLFVDEDRKRGEPALERSIALRTGRSEDDRWSQRKDGSRFWANGIVTRLADEAGRPIGFSKIVRDRTDVKAQVETYANRVLALERAAEQRDLFLGALAHELRNPLGALSNAAQLLGLTYQDVGRVAMPVKLIERQIDFIRRLMEDLLDAARAGRGKVTLDLAPVSLRSVIERAVESCGSAVTEANQHVEVLLPEGGIDLVADGTRLQQVFVNLIANASKFSPPDATIWVRGTVEGAHAVVRIEDHGRGIPREMIPHVFELFTQAAPHDTRMPPGLGIGLALVKGIVELHGGTVHAQSEGEGHGTVMIVRIPMRQEAARARG